MNQVFQSQLRHRLALLDLYISKIQSGEISSPQEFYWEEGGLQDEHKNLMSPYHESRGSFARHEHIKKCKKSGLVFRETEDGFTLELPASHIFPGVC